MTEIGHTQTVFGHHFGFLKPSTLSLNTTDHPNNNILHLPLAINVDDLKGDGIFRTI